jgi:hypothetical protein
MHCKSLAGNRIELTVHSLDNLLQDIGKCDEQSNRNYLDVRISLLTLQLALRAGLPRPSTRRQASQALVRGSQ